MRVREVTISNFRAFGGDHTFALSERVTVIAGVNGRGKTALLDAIATLLSRLLVSLDLVDNYRLLWPADVNRDAEEAKLTMRASCAGTNVDFSVRYQRLRRRVKTSPLAPAVKKAIRNGYGDPSRADDQAPLAVYYTTDRAGFRLPRTLPTKLPDGQRLAGARALINRMVDYRDFMARYRYWLSEPKHARTVKAFNHALAVFLGDFDDVEIDESPLRLSVRKSGYRLGLDQLSDGERSFLAIVSDLVRRLALANPELKNPLLGAGVVLIDELELHLHPTWQRSVADKLRATFPNIQFIATTHSPFVLQSLKAGELINLDPDEFGAEYAGKSVEDIAEQVMGVRVPQKSERFLAMVKTAEEYLRRARSAAPTSNAAADALRTDLDKLIEPYSDDPAYVALLRLEREKALGGGQHAAN